jgi:hypothetical protein
MNPVDRVTYKTIVEVTFGAGQTGPTHDALSAGQFVQTERWRPGNGLADSLALVALVRFGIARRRRPRRRNFDGWAETG